MSVVAPLDPASAKRVFPLFPRLARILAGTTHVGEPRINLGHAVGIEGRTGFLHRGSKTPGVPVPEDALDGSIELLGAGSSGSRSRIVQTLLCLGNILQRCVDFDIVHQQCYVVAL